MTAQWRILSLPPLDEGLVRALFAQLGDAAEITFPATRDRAGLHAALADADIVIGDFTGELALDAEAVAAAPRLAFVQQPSVGTDSLDLDALAAAGVPVANTAGFNFRAVAEWAVAGAFALCRHLAWGDRKVREGKWPQMELIAGRGPREIHTQRIGIVGYGAIGAETARIFQALGCDVSYWSRSRRPEASATYCELDDLLAHSDILVVAVPLTPETQGLLGTEKLALLPEGAFLVNVARGGIAPDDAVLAALESGRLAGAALDVFDQEPPPVDSPLRTHENVLASPHTAGGTRTSQIALVTKVQANVTAAVEGRPVIDVVNGLPPEIKRR
ncbi:2-hydroxyacid dehydrogenase [Actinomadura barringtoniae]|uniref:2-hydroxyacid dehydrogenase n=1 Tax=Actinomadura barringtoniae TaxID=1427535 RepID=A0A939T2V2_9ACTN|nr:2-hydroxyacid dehydrogenase [Actinomadura barringtoniae]MBO2447173.1 2-hydroxyacid dehydrogenase [Actinomadura barringtoniae]